MSMVGASIEGDPTPDGLLPGGVRSAVLDVTLEMVAAEEAVINESGTEAGDEEEAVEAEVRFFNKSCVFLSLNPFFFPSLPSSLP